ncbi:MAG: LacI family transcriptional regulator, partial [Ruminococcaceae bacterium]|nr:LacI family transcriptional regulator [Oscillospiraceae bacterium]
RARGYSTLFMTSGYDPDEEKACVSRMLSMNAAGIILCSVLPDLTYYDKFSGTATPIIAVSNRIHPGIPYAGIDDYRAMYDAARHIIDRGWEKIYYISPVLSKEGQNIDAQSERARGFRDAVAGTDIRWEMIDSKEAFSAFSPDTGCRSALLCSSDAYTQQCIVRFRREIDSGKLGLMGFDNVASLRLLYPELASVAYDTCRIGVEAVKLMLDGGGQSLIPYEIIGGNTI